MDEVGVDAAILHPPVSWDPESNEQAVEAVLAYPKCFEILGNPRSMNWKAARSSRPGKSVPACWVSDFISANHTIRPGQWTAPWIGFGQPPRKRECRWPYSQATGCLCWGKSQLVIRH